MKNKAKNSMIKIKKLYKTSLFVAFAILTLGFSSSSALAMAPTLSVYSNSNNLTQISVNGDSNSSVILYYYPNGGNSVVSSALGSTNQNGYFNTTVNTNTYNISSNSSVYVVVDGAQSNTINWPYNSFNNISGNLYLNQSSIYIDSGHTVVDYINGGSGYYVSSDSNSGVATAYITGNAVNVSGYSSGTADITICSNYSNSGCVILHVTVNGDGHNYYQNSPVSLSQSSVSVGIGQSANVGISGGTGTYYVSSNLNQYLATVSISGNTLTVYGRQVGSESVTVCSTVQNGASNNISNSYIYNSCSNINISIGQNFVSQNSGSYTSGVFLSQIPYTGFGSSTGLIFFIIGLCIWSTAVAYFIFKKNEMNSPVQTANSSNRISRKDFIERFKRENLERRG